MFKQFWRDFRRLPSIDARWITVWFLLYVSFILLDVFFIGFWGSSVLKYTGVFLCIIYAHKKYPEDNLLFFALLFTFLADTILIWISPSWEFFGVLTFCAAQFMHMLRLTSAQPHVIGLNAAIVLLVFLIAMVSGVAPLYAISAIYAMALVCNLCLAHSRYRKGRANFRRRCAFYGFAFFLTCDFCVALRHLILDGIFPAQFLPLISFLVWVFYYPSQVLIANSSTLPKSTTGNKIAKNTVIS